MTKVNRNESYNIGKKVIDVTSQLFAPKPKWEPTKPFEENTTQTMVFGGQIPKQIDAQSFTKDNK